MFVLFDLQFQQLLMHFTSAHLAVGAYVVATMRNIPDAHPLYKLLKPHMRYTITNNLDGWEFLFSKYGAASLSFGLGYEGCQEVFKRGATRYRVHWSNIKKHLKERGVDDATKLPGYHYRDFGIKLWDAMETYVKKILDLHYKSDDDVKNDKEVQDWAKDISHEGFPGYHGAPQGHGFPEKIESKAALVEYCTLIIFTATAHHSSVNYGSFYIYGYAPNAPIGMRKPPPTTKGNLEKYTLMEYLPDITTAAVAGTVAAVLSRYSEDEVYIINHLNFIL